MVQVIPESSRSSLFAQSIGQGLSGIEQNYFRPAQQNQQEYSLNKSRLTKALEGVRGLSKNSTPFEATASILEATAGIPGSEKYVGPLLQTLLPQLQAKAAGDVPLTPAQRKEQNKDFLQANPVSKRGKGPGFGDKPGQDNRFFPTNQPGNEFPGQMSEPETTTGKYKLANPDQLFAQGKQISDQRTAGGMPTTPEQGLELAKLYEDAKKTHNAQVDVDTQNRKTFQKEYGLKAAQYARNALGDEITDEQEAYFKKVGEQAASENKSEADIDRYLAIEAKNFKKSLENVRNKIPAQRSYNMPKQAFLGTDRPFEKRRSDLRYTLQPLLDKGLYDTARKELTDIGYYPEEIESIISNLGETASKEAAQMPNIDRHKKSKGGGIAPGGFGPPSTREYTAQETEDTTNSIFDILSKDPTTNLILLRKAVEDKGVDWQLYKDIINQAIDQKIFTPSGDQALYQIDSLDEGPLNFLGKIMHGLKFIGR